MNKEGIKQEVRNEVIVKETNSSNEFQSINMNTSDIDKKSVLFKEQGRTTKSSRNTTDILVTSYIEERNHKFFCEIEKEFSSSHKQATDTEKKRIKNRAVFYCPNRAGSWPSSALALKQGFELVNVTTNIMNF